MGDAMICRPVMIQDDERDAVRAEADNRGVSMAKVLRQLAEEYLRGDIVLEDRKRSSDGTQTAFHLPKETLAYLETHGKEQGYSFGMLMSALIENRYLKNKTGGAA